MRIRTSYPGQAVQEREAPPNIVDIIQRFGPPPFIEVIVDPSEEVGDISLINTTEVQT